MLVGNTLLNLNSYSRIERPAAAPRAAVEAPSVAPVLSFQQLQARDQLIRVLDAVAELDRLVNGSKTVLTGVPSSRSQSALGLDLRDLAATRVSTDEVNANTGSYGPFEPAWNIGATSTSMLTVGGDYNGENGAGDLVLEVLRGGVRGVDRPRIRVYDPLGDRLTTRTIRENHALDRKYSIGNGMYFVVGAGTLTRDDTATVTLSDTISSAADPDQPFIGIGSFGANIEYSGSQVRNGTVRINGETIAIAETDSINSALDKINASAAGVTASYNEVTEQVEIVANQTGPGGSVNLQNDNARLFRATKLWSGTTLPGRNADNLATLDQVDAFSSVSSGNLVVNGENIAIDVGNDSLDDVLTRISTSDAGVTAQLSPDGQRVTLTSDSAETSMDIDANGTGFFAALAIQEGTVAANGRGRGYSERRSLKINAAVADTVKTLNTFFRETAGRGREDATVNGLRNQLEGALRGLLGNGEVSKALGIRLDLDASGDRFRDVGSVDRNRLAKKLRSSGPNVKALLNGADGRQGLLQIVEQFALSAVRGLNELSGTKGSVFDTFA